MVVMMGGPLLWTLSMLLIARRDRGESTTRQQLRIVVLGFFMYALLVAPWLLYHATGPGIDEVFEHIWTLAGITMTIGAFASAIVHIIMPVGRDGPGSTESFGLPPVRIRAAKGALSAPRPRMFRPLRALVCVVALASAPNDWLAPFMVLGVFLASDGLAEGWFNPKRWTAIAAHSPRTVATEQAEISRIIARAQRSRPGTAPTPPVPPAAT